MKDYIKPDLERIDFTSEAVASSAPGTEGGFTSNDFDSDGPWN